MEQVRRAIRGFAAAVALAGALSSAFAGTTTTSITSSANPSTVNAAVTLTTTVTGTNLNGTLTVYDGAAVLRSQALRGDNVVTSFSTSTLANGTHNITAAFTADRNGNTASTSPVLVQQVNGIATNTTLAVTPSPGTAGTAVQLKATVTAGTARPTGTVTFMDDTVSLGTATVSQTTGIATLSKILTAGIHDKLRALYGGGALYAASTSPLVQETISLNTSTVTLSFTPKDTTYGAVQTASGKVTGFGTPTGTVTLLDGSTTIATATLSNGNYSVGVWFPTLGTHVVRARYDGDANNATSLSGQVYYSIINQATPGMTLTATPATVGQGQTFTLQARVYPPDNGVSPTGNVSFGSFGSAPLVNGYATLTATSQSTGTNNITVSYAGDANFVARSGTLAVKVNPNSTVTLAATPNPATLGQFVALTSTVTGNSPTGTVTFMDGTATLGTVTLSSGVATMNAAGLGVGAHSLRAVYSGDANNGANSATLTATVNPRATTTSVATSGTPTTYGSTATFTATVTGASPTGSVTFKDGGTVLGSAAVSNGVAAFSTSAISAGTRTITAEYSGDATNAASSGTVTQTVNQQASGTALAATPTPSAVGQAVTLTATIAAANATGTVTFRDGAATLGTGTISGGTASFNATELAPGSHSLTAVYAGDVNHTGSTSAAVVQAVNAGASTTTLTATPVSAMLGEVVTLRANIAGYNATGAVTFRDGATTLGSANLQGGVSTLAVSNLAQGTHNITASYAGDTNNAASTSSAATVVVANRSGYTWRYEYDAMGRQKKVIDPNAQSTSTSYDKLGRTVKTEQPANTGSPNTTATSFGWNAGDALTSVTDPRGLTTTYTVDGLGNTKAEASPDRGSLSYTHDGNGNVLTKTDARGKTTTYTYAYNDRGRMASSVTPSGSVSYLTNGLELRAYKASPNGNRYFLYDEQGVLLGQYDANGASIHETIYLGSTPVGVMKQGVTYNAYADQIATPRVITKQDHTIVWRWDAAEAFGATAPNQDPSGLGVLVLDQRFPGQTSDSETGLFDNWHRQYDPRRRVGYIQPDPIGQRGGRNFYGYVGNSPLEMSDASGLITTKGAAEMIFKEMKASYPGTFSELNPTITTLPWAGNGSTLGSWININPLRYGITLDCLDLYQLIATVAHEAQHTRQSLWQQVMTRRLTDANYNRSDPHWIIEDRAHEIAAELYKKLKNKCECEAK